MRIAIGIATTGRREILTAAVFDLTRQTRPADEIFICAAKPDDVDRDALAPLGDLVRIDISTPGLPSQRNFILNRAQDCDVLVFLDDDFFMRPDFLANAEKVFASHPDVVIATGTLIADGVRGRGYTPEEGLAMIETDRGGAAEVNEIYSAYGCNMAIRMRPVRDNGLTFDEALPLYAWLEDLDFTRRIARFGRSVEVGNLRGVHLATKKGRVSGVRFGYSQVANPLYLYRKSSIPLSLALRRVLRFCISNIMRSAFPETYIDRFGRARGNWIALADLIRGRLDPRRILSL